MEIAVKYPTAVNSSHSTVPAGRKIAETMYERHTLLSDWLIYLGVDPQKAVEDACRMEHILSAESFHAIKQHVLANQEQTENGRHA